MNPFHPAPGALPKRIVGREPELSAMREAVRRSIARSAPVPIVLVGQRGMGKTVLLRELRELGAADTLSVALEIIRDQPLSQTLHEKVNAVVASVDSIPVRAARALEAAAKTAPNVSFELPRDAGTIALGPRDDEPRTEEHRSLVAMLAALAAAARSAKRYLTITVDEMQDADLASMQTLVRFVHESAQTSAPVLFACAGLVESYGLLEKLRTYVQRWTTFDLRLLTHSETVEAIREPILAAHASIEDAALDALVHEAAGYPYFIQIYGSAAWEAHRGKTVTLADVGASLPDARARNEASFYVRPLARISPRETAFVLELARLGPGPHDVGAIAKALGATTPDLSSIRSTLIRKSIVSSPLPGKIEFRIPFTDRYLQTHRDDYETPEVLAYRRSIAKRKR